MNRLQAWDLWKTFGEKKAAVHALCGVDISIPDGEITAIVGPSGAGKSTLIHLLAGLDQPTKGSIQAQGSFGLVFQSYHLLQHLTALENVMLPPCLQGKRQDKANALALLKRVGLENRAKHFPSELSGGEAQRVAIARALSSNPDILLCDEPTGNLDSENGKMIGKILKELSVNDKKTIVIVTHDDKIAELATKRIHMEDGRIVS